MTESTDSSTGKPLTDPQGPDVPDLAEKEKPSSEVDTAAADNVKGGALPRDKTYPGGPVPIPYPNL